MAIISLVLFWLSLSFLSLATLDFDISLDTNIERRAISTTLFNTLQYYEQLAAAAYCPGNDQPGSTTKVVCPTGNCPLVQAANVVTILEFENSLVTDVTGYVAVDYTNSLIVVAFRGSVSVQNFLADADFPLVPIDICDDCLGEAGFWESWEEARAGVLGAVANAASANPSFRLVSTGHSLGGAIAAFAAADLRKRGYAVDLCTFGQPRIGDQTTAQYITAQAPAQGQNYRVTHYNDIVPRLPPTLFGFSHTSPEYYINAPNKAAVTPDEITEYTGLNQKNGNGAWLLTDVVAHGWYFNQIAQCVVDLS